MAVWQTSPIPQNARELYDMLMRTPDLCGMLTLVGDHGLDWELYEGFTVSIGINRREGYIGIEKRLAGKITDGLTHWHPALDEIYGQLCIMGRPGNVLVIRRNPLFCGVVYRGPESECPYPPAGKWSRGRLYYLKAKSEQQ